MMRKYLLAVLAIALLLPAVAWAAPKFTGDDIVDETLTGQDVADGSLAGADIADNSLTGADVDENTLTLPPGPVGPQGPVGPRGPTGPQGPAGSYPAGDNLPQGATLRGTFALTAQSSRRHGHILQSHDHVCLGPLVTGCEVLHSGDLAVDLSEDPEQIGMTGISFGYFISTPQVHVIPPFEVLPEFCGAGGGGFPDARPGHLCIFVTRSDGSGTLTINASPMGARLELNPGEAGTGVTVVRAGSWAVTAP